MVSFTKAVFCGEKLDFSFVEFENPVTFCDAHFASETNFQSIISKRSFDLADATFENVPNFIEASFHEAPRLDNVEIPEIGGYWKKDRVGEKLPAMYRALKRLAVTGHDHKNEMDFFAGEIKSARYNTVFPCFGGENVWSKVVCSLAFVIIVLSVFAATVLMGNWYIPLVFFSVLALLLLAIVGLKQALETIMYFLDSKFLKDASLPVVESPQIKDTPKKRYVSLFWLGVFYEEFSNFGRSFLRPLLALCALVVLSAGVFYWKAGEQTSCVNSTQGKSAFYLSSRYSVPFILGQDKAKTQAARTCLFGATQSPINEKKKIALVPDWLVVWGGFQSLLSLVLIFLFGLAIRNHFRIK